MKRTKLKRYVLAMLAIAASIVSCEKNEEDVLDNKEILQLKNGKELSFAESQSLAKKNNLKDVKLFTQLGKGVNKRAYSINNSSWVVLSGDNSPEKERLLIDEVEQLLNLKVHGVPTPDLGVTTSKQAIFTALEGSKRSIAFLEEKIIGFEITRKTAEFAFTDTEIKEFGDAMANSIAQELSFKTAQQSRITAINSLESISFYIKNVQDIPDFQVRFEQSTGRIVVLDPGDPKAAGDVSDKHLKWIKTWKDFLNDKRYLSRIWNKLHPNNKINSDGRDWRD